MMTYPAVLDDEVDHEGFRRRLLQVRRVQDVRHLLERFQRLPQRPRNDQHADLVVNVQPFHRRPARRTDVLDVLAPFPNHLGELRLGQVNTGHRLAFPHHFLRPRTFR